MELARVLFLIGSAFFILVGALHTFVHFKQLVSSEAENKIAPTGTVGVMSSKAQIWKLWQGMSLMFGILLSVVGLNNILALYEMGPESFPPVSICIVNMLVLILVIFSGFKYFSKMQVYGGVVGLILFGTTIYLSI